MNIIKLAEIMINRHLESNENSLLTIALENKSIQGLELSEDEKVKKKIKLIENRKNNNFIETEPKKAREKLNMMCQWLYLDEYYINKEEKKEILKEIINAPEWMLLNEEHLSKQKIEWSEIIKDVVIYHINKNKEFLKEFLKTDNLRLKVLIAESIIHEVKDDKYNFNKVGKEVIKESIGILYEYTNFGVTKFGITSETILCEDMSNYGEKNIRNEKPFERHFGSINMWNKCYLDILIILNENKKIGDIIRGKEKIFTENPHAIEPLMEKINEGKIEEKTIISLIPYMGVDFFVKLTNKYRNNIDIVNCSLNKIATYSICSSENNKFYWNCIGTEIKEVLSLKEDNYVEKLSKYDSINTEGILGYIGKRKKEKLQEEINKRWEKKEKEYLSDWNYWHINEWLKSSEDIKVKLNQEELTELSSLEKEIKEINELGLEYISQYNIQEIRESCEYILKIMGAEEFIPKIEEVKEKIEKIKEEIKEKIKMELKKEVAVIKYKF